MTLNPIPETTAHIINGGTNMTVRANIERAIGQPLPAVGQFRPWTREQESVLRGEGEVKG
jgi:hypothetical protein